ncbi:MAG: TraR/DksA family transcriptional regulator [Alphaproteobacteria bacterium]
MSKRAHIAKVRQRLLSRRDELRGLIDDAREAQAPVELDQTRIGRLSRMDALQDQALARATLRLREEELQRIGAALKRLETDDYGYCVACGDDIDPKRLELDPTVPTCIDCAQAAGRG